MEAYRTHGHRVSSVNPLNLSAEKEHVPELEVSRYGLQENNEVSDLAGLVSFEDSRVENVAALNNKLNEIYCQNISAEFNFIESEYERAWFSENFERILEEKNSLSSEEKRKLATQMIQFQEFDRFMNIKLPSIKRYGGEGSESTVAFFRNLLLTSSENEIDTIVLAMPHRGKLNALATLFQQRPAKIFRKYRGLPEFSNDVEAMMDIPNHFSKTKNNEDFCAILLSFLNLKMFRKTWRSRMGGKFTYQCFTIHHILKLLTQFRWEKRDQNNRVFVTVLSTTML